MRTFAQGACILALALGAGLFTGGNYLSPDINISNVNAIANFSQMTGHFRDYHETAAFLRGFGVGFMMLGGVGLIVPWIYIFLDRAKSNNQNVTQ